MFSQEETQSLLAEKGIGKTVLQRLQQMGLDDVAKLAAADVDDMLQQGAAAGFGNRLTAFGAFACAFAGGQVLPGGSQRVV